MDFGIKAKCENCKYGFVKIENRKVKEVFCRKLKGNISVAYYKQLRVCNFFEKER